MAFRPELGNKLFLTEGQSWTDICGRDVSMQLVTVAMGHIHHFPLAGKGRIIICRIERSGILI